MARDAQAFTLAETLHSEQHDKARIMSKPVFAKKPVLAALLSGGAVIASRVLAARAPRRAERVTEGDRAMHRYIAYIAFPVWLASGFLDYIWHRRTKIETTAGISESLMHSLMMAEAGPAVLGAMFLEINAGALAMIISAATLHEITAIWDVVFTAQRRVIRPAEQHTHSFLEMVPFCVASIAVCMHWDQFLALIGKEKSRPDFALRLRRPAIPWQHLLAMASALVAIGAVPHVDELRRCWQAQQQKLVGRDTPECAGELFGSRQPSTV
jgi:hypothetical protein